MITASLGTSENVSPPFGVVLPVTITSIIVEQKFIICKRFWFEFPNFWGREEEVIQVIRGVVSLSC